MLEARGLAMVLLALALGAGCGAAPGPRALGARPQVTVATIPAPGVEAAARPERCYLDVVLDRSPERPYVLIGQVTAIWTGADRAALGTTAATVLPHLRRQACRAGGHVLYDIRSFYQDQWLEARGAAPRGFMRTIRMTGLVAAYVRRDGAFEPAPALPRSVIRVPAPVPPSAPAPLAAEPLAWDQGIADPWVVPAP
jgi:hypothetical protein